MVTRIIISYGVEPPERTNPNDTIPLTQTERGALLAEYCDMLGAPPYPCLDDRLAWCARQYLTELAQCQVAAAMYAP